MLPVPVEKVISGSDHGISSAAIPEDEFVRKHSGRFSPLFMACSDCGETKRITEFRRGKCKGSRYGYSFRKSCKRCESARRAGDERYKAFKREWSRRPEVRERKRKHDARRLSTPQGRLAARVGRQVRGSLTRGTPGEWRLSLPFTFEELREHLERQFLPGMTWENIGEWHIDHIVPKSSFSYESPDDPDFLACWDLTNLRPLWAEDNLRKGDRVEVLI